MQYITTPHQAELNAADKMKSWGFTDAVATTGGQMVGSTFDRHGRWRR
ncbi:hypothetical protein M2405_006306 [Rhodococcus erythropolis]|nr:hypothetical protein [Rhodococcus erythropolis]MCW2430126.1 hypothetical protein [Rhodococcus erythropolis]